jgi:HlyD family secretion protein
MKRMIAAVAAVLAAAGCNEDVEGVYTGYVEAELVRIAPPQAGWLVALHVSEGDRVEPGGLLFELDTDQQQLLLTEAQARLGEAGARVDDASQGARAPEIAALRAQLQEARAQLSYAETELARTQRLANSGAVAPAQLDDANTQRETARARVKAAEEAIRVAQLAARDGVQGAAQAQQSAAEASLEQVAWLLEQRRVVSRRKGRVEMITHREGEYVTAGTSVLELLPDDALKVRFFVPQAELTRFAPGTVVRVQADGAEAVDATISYVASEAEFTPPVIYSASSRDQLVFAVEARLPAGTVLNAGLPVDVTLPAAQTAQ